MDSMRLENILSTLLLCAVITTCLEPSSPRRRTTKFDVIPVLINVLKNETVEFICEQNANTPFNIRFKGIVLVQNKKVVEQFSNIFDFQILGLTTGNLTLKHATEEYKGTYICGEGVDEKFAAIVNVYTLISSKPICKSSIEIGPYIFEDQIDLIEMNCTSEDGVPHVTMSNHIILGNKTTDVTSISTKTTSSHPYPSKTLSLSSYFSSSFNNSVFVCNVSQQLPVPYNQSYQGSCSLGPILLLHLFSVAVTPSEIICSNVKNHIFKCTSNVSEVDLTWTNIPSHWKYDISEGDTYIQLYVTDTGSDVCPVNIPCVGHYRNRNITSTIQISATSNPGRVIAVLLVVIFICSCFVCVIIIAVRKYHLNVPKCNRKSLSRMTVQARENASTNNANDRNYSINDDAVSPIVSQTDNDYALNVPGTEVSYGDITTMDYNEINEINDSGPDITVPLVITAISLCLILIIVIVVLYFRLNVSFCNRNSELAKQNSSTNNANDRNTTITDDVVSSMRSHAENSALDVPAMIDNTIYETYTEKDCQNQTLSETERLEKEQEIEMVENEIYESNSFSGYV